ncbi:GSCFA family protein [Alteromonas sp. KS69]|uniref:GSCFA domain-containing protein n=1 Tax=Alteromonas sp. KS69 TaxID=2109917 RepID=UPI000F866E7D|nr:GSCFA domain-containing protein [Alteromonas sp. KS69]RUP83088.1 GSCFA family protein [Alteromonas sp. KS69]|tara:strand:+ start:2470 stop:3528 length:1059 start_codon:yes stop_codon:yes gene_type:complete
MSSELNPYKNKPQKSFWSPAVAKRHFYDIENLWDPKFKIERSDRVTTFGSCFAQHIGNALRAHGFNWFITEKAPLNSSSALRKKYNYEVFSARTGNIYTTSLLKQWVNWSLNPSSFPDNLKFWEKDGRYIDPFRPVIEPEGFSTLSELENSRFNTLSSFKLALKKSDIFVFTLGLTESWVNQGSSIEFPLCPGTVAGEYSSSRHEFVNQTYDIVVSNLSAAIDQIRKINPSCKFILTVSPVPLTATNTNEHVLVATMKSKSILRAAADFLSGNLDYVDYFPSYEIINSPVFRGTFFEPNLRQVNSRGVSFVMETFFRCMNQKFGLSTSAMTQSYDGNDELVCEEELLSAFGE